MEPDEVESTLERANELLAEGKPAETLRCLAALTEAVLDADDRMECVTLKAWALSELGRNEDALELLEPLLEDHAPTARLLGTLGVVLSNADELDDACAILEQAVELDGEDDVAIANLALVYEKLREFERANVLYDRALSLGADIDWILERKSEVQVELGDYAGAKATLRRYLSLAPDAPGSWISLAILHSDGEEFEQAFQCYRRAEEIDPNSAALCLNWGVTALRAGRLDEAARQLEHLEQIEPHAPRATLLKAFILEERQDFRQAERCYARALCDAEGNPEELTYALEMAMDYHARRGQRERCEELFRRAYASNSCTVELCEAYREATGRKLANAAWLSLIVEADCRPGLCEAPARRSRVPDEVPTDNPDEPPHYTRFLRNIQVVAADRDEAIAAVQDLLARMGEHNCQVREFVNEEELADAYSGVYEIESVSTVFRDDDPG